MPKDPTIAIRDCLAEIAILHEIAARMTLQAFRSDPIARRAAAYAIQTISEAVRHIPDDWLADFPTEPWGQIRGIGNRIRHEYFRQLGHAGARFEIDHANFGTEVARHGR
jgi:uncharacterized protein with HEPN domain